MGPNDASRVVWALGEFFIYFHHVFFFSYLMIYIDITDSLELQCGSTQATTTTMGPNNVSRVVWPLGEVFFIYFFYTYYYI